MKRLGEEEKKKKQMLLGETDTFTLFQHLPRAYVQHVTQTRTEVFFKVTTFLDEAKLSAKIPNLSISR